MPDEKAKRGKRQDRSRVTTVEGYGVSYFAQKHGISAGQARGLIQRIGNDRKELNAAAEKLTVTFARGLRVAFSAAKGWDFGKSYWKSVR